jgi:hypothetical protein
VLKKIVIALFGLALAAVQSGPAFAYGHANAYGGSTSHSYGSTSHSNAYGGSSSHTYGSGTTHTNTYGGTTSGAYGHGATHTNVYGGTTSGAYGSGAYHSGGYYGYPPPPPHYATGCYNCYSSCVGCIAGAAVVGAAVGYSMGEKTASVPTSGCANQTVSGATYYVCGTTWFKPAYGANGLYYTVVPAP